MIIELRARGQGNRESGCFLLSPRRNTGGRVTEIIYFDDLDPECLTGGISFDGLAFSALWAICRQRGIRVIGDVHTHPGSGVRQSSTDRDNPMVSQAGHVGVILPNYARGPISAVDAGLHLYQGEDGWRSWLGAAAAKRIYVGRAA